MSNYFVGFIGNIFGGGRRRKQKICHSYKCAQCTSNRHCSGNQYCSGYTCVSHQTYTPYTTTKSPFYDFTKDFKNFNSYTPKPFEFTTPKPFDFPKSNSYTKPFDAQKFISDLKAKHGLNWGVDFQFMNQFILFWNYLWIELIHFFRELAQVWIQQLYSKAFWLLKIQQFQQLSSKSQLTSQLQSLLVSRNKCSFAVYFGVCP